LSGHIDLTAPVVRDNVAPADGILQLGTTALVNFTEALASTSLKSGTVTVQELELTPNGQGGNDSSYIDLPKGMYQAQLSGATVEVIFDGAFTAN
ncbi:MAG TPA: hypothetical protein DCR93_09180, partial [Cytophagales bacterium]|nr:hypothetical protein [Cytophagales bacterium]